MLAKGVCYAFDLILVLSIFGSVGQVVSQDDMSTATWGVLDSTRTKTCVMLSGYFEVAIPYLNNFGERPTTFIKVPRDASVAGSCESAEDANAQEITLMWSPEGHPELGLMHNLTFLFVRRGIVDGQAYVLDPYYELYAIQALIWKNPYDFPNAYDEEGLTSYTLGSSNLGILSAPVGLSYACKATETLKFEDGSIILSHVRAEAFHTELALGDGRDFGPKSFCTKDGFEVILMVITYVTILALIGLAVFYIVDRRSKGSYIYL